MGDAIAVVMGLVVLGGLATLLIAGLARSRGNSVLSKRPSPLLGVHEEKAAIAKATVYYRLSQRAVRTMEKMTSDPTVYLEDKHREAMQEVIDDFYDREGQ